MGFLHFEFLTGEVQTSILRVPVFLNRAMRCQPCPGYVLSIFVESLTGVSISHRCSFRPPFATGLNSRVFSTSQLAQLHGTDKHFSQHNGLPGLLKSEKQGERLKKRVEWSLAHLQEKLSLATENWQAKVAKKQMEEVEERARKEIKMLEEEIDEREAQRRSWSGPKAEEKLTIDYLDSAMRTSATSASEVPVRTASKNAAKKKPKAAETTGAFKAALKKKSKPEKTAAQPERPKEQWQIQKVALEKKFSDEGWNPRKRLSPDAIEGIRAMHAQYPDQFTTPVLAKQFEVSPEVIRRILKSKWRPTPEEAEERRQRWDRRGERIWSNQAEMGQRPPKKWREMGVGRAKPGEAPKWSREYKKSRHPENIYTTPKKEDIIATRPDAERGTTPNVPSEGFADRIL